MKHRLLCLTYLGSLMAMSVVGLGYAVLSRGLAAPTPQGPFFCRELLSSGSDDDLMVGAFTLFAIPLLYRIARWNRDVSVRETIVFGICLATTGLALWLASLDCASLVYTAFWVPDLFLATAILALPISAGALAWLRAGR